MLQLTGRADLLLKVFIKATRTKHKTHISLLPTSMGCPSGYWGINKEKLLGDLLCSNTIDYRNRTAEYLFSVTEEQFPNFISPGASGRNSAIQHM
jgi:hypothetical protein